MRRQYPLKIETLLVEIANFRTIQTKSWKTNVLRCFDVPHLPKRDSRSISSKYGKRRTHSLPTNNMQSAAAKEIAEKGARRTMTTDRNNEVYVHIDRIKEQLATLTKQKHIA